MGEHAQVDPNEVEALAHVLAPAHRKLRLGSQHPTNPSGPNSLARSIARALLARRVINVEIEEQEEVDTDGPPAERQAHEA